MAASTGRYTPKQSIKIRKDKLYINGHPHGQVIDSEYTLLAIISDFPPKLTASQRHQYWPPLMLLQLNLLPTLQETPQSMTAMFYTYVCETPKALPTKLLSSLPLLTPLHSTFRLLLKLGSPNTFLIMKFYQLTLQFTARIVLQKVGVFFYNQSISHLFAMPFSFSPGSSHCQHHQPSKTTFHHTVHSIYMYMFHLIAAYRI